jgi:hypothetical protein
LPARPHAGNIHFELLSAATFALGFRMWDLRKALVASVSLCMMHDFDRSP